LIHESSRVSFAVLQAEGGTGDLEPLDCHCAAQIKSYPHQSGTKSQPFEKDPTTRITRPPDAARRGGAAHSLRRRRRRSSPYRRSGTRIHAKRSAIRRGDQGENDGGYPHLKLCSAGAWRRGGVARRTSRSTTRNCRSLNHTLLESSTCTPSVGLNEAPGTDMGTSTLVYARVDGAMRLHGGGGALEDHIPLLRPSQVLSSIPGIHGTHQPFLQDSNRALINDGNKDWLRWSLFLLPSRRPWRPRFVNGGQGTGATGFYRPDEENLADITRFA
jgi:hypothetical protein